MFQDEDSSYFGILSPIVAYVYHTSVWEKNVGITTANLVVVVVVARPAVVVVDLGCQKETKRAQCMSVRHVCLCVMYVCGRISLSVARGSPKPSSGIPAGGGGAPVESEATQRA